MHTTDTDKLRTCPVQTTLYSTALAINPRWTVGCRDVQNGFFKFVSVSVRF